MLQRCRLIVYPRCAVAGPEGVAAAMAPGKGYVDVSTVDAATAAAVAEAVRAAGGAYLEAPVSGSKGPAEQGQLIFLTGGVCLQEAKEPMHQGWAWTQLRARLPHPCFPACLRTVLTSLQRRLHAASSDPRCLH